MQHMDELLIVLFLASIPDTIRHANHESPVTGTNEALVAASEADEHGQRLVLVEIGGALGARSAAGEDAGQDNRQAQAAEHGFPPVDAAVASFKQERKRAPWSGEP